MTIQRLVTVTLLGLFAVLAWQVAAAIADARRELADMQRLLGPRRRVG